MRSFPRDWSWDSPSYAWNRQILLLKKESLAKGLATGLAFWESQDRLVLEPGALLGLSWTNQIGLLGLDSDASVIR
jgi:hypothetical protein